MAPPPGVPFDHGVFETRLSPLPEEAEDVPATILNIPLEEVLKLDWRAGSIWSEEQLRAKLKRAPRLVHIS